MERISFNDGWLFKKEDGTSHKATLPHDAMQTERRGPGSPSGSGNAWFEGGVYEYEKTFRVPEEWEGKSVFFEFEAAYPMAQVTLNGVSVGGCAYGYEQFLIPGDGLRCGAENTLLVRVDGSGLPNSRWYSGAGLHRPANVYVGEREHIEPYGVRVRTVSIDPAAVEVTVRHTGEESALVEIFDADTLLARAVGDRVVLELSNARLWSDEEPYLYTCKATLPNGDSESVAFGVRSLEWNAGGLYVNGKAVKLRGGCVHHDNGILGARSFPEAEWRRVKRLKTAGFNAIRSSHYPASRSMLDACDALGLFVMDEGWDMWYNGKTAFDYSSRFEQNWERDLAAMVEKDYNHPCVVMYSIGNEVSEPAEERGLALARRLVDTLHSLDASRPVTTGANLAIILSHWRRVHGTVEERQDEPPTDSAAFNALMAKQFLGMLDVSATDEADEASSPYFDIVDIAGYNYASPRYELDGERHPGRIIVGSETFPYMLADNWAAVEKYPYLIGDFMWTAWDYLGETGLGAWSASPDAKVFAKPYPWLLADSGAFDILGNDNAEAGLAMTVWGTREEPYIGVAPPLPEGTPVYKGPWRGTDAIPHWSWRGSEGIRTRVEVYSKAPAVALYLNGRLIGTEKTQKCRADFTLPYTPGQLRAAALDGEGREISSFALRSAAGELRVRLTPEDRCVPGKLMYIGVDIVGKNGEVECGADTLCRASVTGGELLAFGSADPRTESRFSDGVYRTYRGSALAAVVPSGGPLTFTVEAEGMPASTIKM